MRPDAKAPEPGRYEHVYAVVLVGGKGKRLRPLSTDKRPKAFLSVTRNRRTMFRNTLERIMKVIPPERIVVVANREHSGLVRKDLPKAAHRNIILEPASRNTAPAIGMAARFILRRDEDAVMLVMPTDQYVSGRQGELKSLKMGLDFAAVNDNVIVVIGLKPRSPSTQFGYIKVAKGEGVIKAERFTEKPDLSTAIKYIAGNGHLWNAGIFISGAGTFLSALKEHAPEIFRRLKKKNTAASYRKMPDLSIDYAVMEQADNIYCVKSSYGWNDLGGFEALEKVLKRESRRYIKKDGKIIKIL